VFLLVVWGPWGPPRAWDAFLLRGFLVLSLVFRLNRLTAVLAVARVRPARALVSGFLGMIALGTAALSLPGAASGERLDFLTALFTATSATCVTGLTVIDPGTDLSGFGQGVLLVLIQVGGLGLMTFTTLFAAALGRRLGLRERELLRNVLGAESLATVGRTLVAIAGFTLLLEAAGTAALYIHWAEAFPDRGERLFTALFHGVSAFCNAGFSLFSQNMERFAGDTWTYGVISILVLAGGLGFFVLQDLLGRLRAKREESGYALGTRLSVSVSLVLLLGGAAILWLLEGDGTGEGLAPGARVVEAVFLSVTARTAGFNTVDVSSMTHAGTMVLLFLMFVGASPASTGGGVKTVTLGVFLAALRSALRGRRRVEIFRRTLDPGDVSRAMGIIVLGAALTGGSAILLAAVEPFSFEDTLFESVSAFGTVGLSRGITASLGPWGRVIIIVTMFLGRIGPMSLGLALVRRGRGGRYEYPKERVRFG
jgi:trk system potassium uptake protein TrkH